jgi:CheY-like chemotaxis protein
MDLPKLIESMGNILWPVIAAVVLWKIFPQIQEILKSRNLKIKIGDMEISAQEASEQLRIKIEDLQNKVSELREYTHKDIKGEKAIKDLFMPPSTPRRILWVDDNPSNNAFEIARLRDNGVEIYEVKSTDEALRLLVTQGLSFRAVISDMGRREGGVFRPKAGISLIQQVRNAGIKIPIFVFTTSMKIEQIRDEVQLMGGNGATASSVELFEMLRDLTV